MKTNAGSWAQPDGRPIFCHTPLDRDKDSIRLLRLSHKLSPDGLIECSMYHVQLSAGAADGATDPSRLSPIPYICLSYSWGYPVRNGAILVDGKISVVRTNLLAFLRVARTQLDYCFLWIDALCIDQTNSAERDHQVQRMGIIFAKARMVISWLGDEPELEQPLHRLGLSETTSPWLACKSFHQRENQKHSIQDYVSLVSEVPAPMPTSTSALQEGEMLTFYVALSGNAYWRRAWVTQEIMLATALYIVAGNAILDYPSLVCSTRYCFSVYPSSHFKHFAHFLLVQKDYFGRKNDATGRILISDSWMNNWGLVNLVHYFEDKCCSVRHDMVYSLLSLSREAEALRVNYNAPTSEVMWQIMNICKDSVCLCTVAVLMRALGHASSQLHSRTPSLLVKVPVRGHSVRNAEYLTECPFCKNPLRLAGRLAVEVVLCLLTACKDAEGHIYKEAISIAADTSCVLTLEPSVECTVQTLGQIGESIGIAQVGNSNHYLLILTFPPLLKIAGGPQWGRTLRQRSCGNLWPDEDRPEMERLGIYTA